MIYPCPNEEKQAKYEEFLEASVRTLPFPNGKIPVANPALKKNNSATVDAKSSPLKSKIKVKQMSKDQVDKPRERVAPKPNKSPYDVGLRRLVTPASQKQRKRDNVSNPKSM